MNFDVNTKLGFNVGAITVSGGATASMSNNKTNNYEEIDYGLVDDIVENWEKTNADKFKYGTAGYIFGKTYFNDWLKGFIFDSEFLKNNSTGAIVGSTVVVSLGSGLIKTLFGLKTGDVKDIKTFLSTFGSGGTGKDLIKGLINGFATKNITNYVYINTVERLIRRILPESHLGFINNLLKATEKNISENTAFNIMWKKAYGGSWLDDGMKILRLHSGDDILDAVFKAGIAKSAWDMSLGTGVDYVASVVTTYISKGITTGIWTYDNFDELATNLKLGQNVLTSSYKTIFGIAFERLFSFAGPAGQKFGKTLGTVVGASIGNFWVSAFNENETWCAIAGAATVIGAIGGIWAGAAIASACSATIPVAGWIVGAAIIVGATAATAVVYLFYWLTGKGG